ncbi:leucine-rich repeat protein 1 isoform X2 [Maniola jurtina]|uniref:leucine-rich repeat protein 1 isoform X2 n=1 Tax=Maniola jurtina TaxID=191418 RepID=UPI001E68D92F|nr:leucine-rich repeat protein 1 isoform X2 [Maniola jurtina]
MKLQCQVEVINRVHSSLNIRSNGKYLRSTVALGKEPKNEYEYFILLFSSNNKNGTKYKVKCMKQVFVKCLNEGKVTLRFDEPPHDLCIKSEVIQLKSFMRLLKSCITGDSKDLKLANLSSIGVTAKDIAPTKLTINDRSEFPAKGLPRTLKSLYIVGLKLCNFRRDILLLNHLSILDLSNNEIEKIPPEFGRLPSLSELYLSNNSLGLSKNPDWRWLFGLQKLKLLDLSGNKLGNLPKDIWKLQNLVTLKVDNNSLNKLPTTLGRISTLRYLSVSKNNLQTLPCSLMHCGLDHIDISTNNFTSETKGPILTDFTPWEFYINSLVHIAAKTVLKHKFFYAPNIIPKTLVEFLDNSNMCVCGKPVLNDKYYIIKQFDLKDFSISRHVIFNFFNKNSSVGIECFFCSPKCFMK